MNTLFTVPSGQDDLPPIVAARTRKYDQSTLSSEDFRVVRLTITTKYTAAAARRTSRSQVHLEASHGFIEEGFMQGLVEAQTSAAI